MSLPLDAQHDPLGEKKKKPNNNAIGDTFDLQMQRKNKKSPIYFQRHALQQSCTNTGVLAPLGHDLQLNRCVALVD